MKTVLGQRMRRFAEEHPHQKLPDGWADAADKFDEACQGFFMDEPATVPVSKFLAAFARARRMWCEATGESLI